MPSKTFHFGPDSEDDSWVVFEAEGGLSLFLERFWAIVEENPNGDLWVDAAVFFRPWPTARLVAQSPRRSRHP